MTDYGQELEFGAFLTPDAAQPRRVLELAQLAEVAGLDLVTLQDHPYQPRHLDAWTLLTAIGARTSAIRLSTNVANLPLRPPVVLAKAAASLDVLTGGRVELGLGAGGLWDPIVAAGGPRRSPGEAVEALEEAIQVMRAFWEGGTVRFEGDHYRAKGLHAGPAPSRPIPIWLGAYKPRMIRLTGRLADAWVPSLGYADPPVLPELNAILDDAAAAAGRAPSEIRRIYNVFGRFGRGSGFLQGEPGAWAEQLAQLTLETGMSTYILGSDDPDDLRRFAAEVAPATRELVLAGRSGSGPAAVADPVPAPSPRPALTVTPTPDDGVRRTEPVWDESERPTTGRPEVDGPEPEAAQHLIEIHDHLRGELAQVRDVLDQVRRGHLEVGQARSVINTMTMRQNNWTLGAYCESYCRVVTGHHTLEDRALFPHLRRSEPGLGAVLDRLEAEHHVIHEVLESFDQALVGLVAADGAGSSGRAALDTVQDAVDRLTDSLLSHLAYEERELVGPLSRHGVQ